MRLDADDLMHPDRVAKIVRHFREHPAVDAIFSGNYVIDESSLVTASQPVTERHSVQEVLKRFFACHPTLAFRTRWARRNPYPTRTKRAEDLELWCECFPTTTFGYIHEPLYFSRLDSGYSLRKYAATANDHCRVILRHGPRLVGIPTTLFLLAKAQTKVAVTAIARLLGVSASRLRRRSLSPISENLQARESEVICTILQLEVPQGSFVAR